MGNGLKNSMSTDEDLAYSLGQPVRGTIAHYLQPALKMH
jgi:hypothetical protein